MRVVRDEAKKVILDSAKIKDFEMITLERAYGRVLAEDICAKFDIPESDKCAIDGFCFCIEDIKTFPVTLKIIGESKAGDQAQKKVGANEAIFTMTGAVVADGADTAVRIEDVIVDKDKVTIKKTPKKGDLINFAGSEVKKGEIVLKKGEMLEYKKVSLLANLGYYQIKVFTKPNIAIIVTGDEVDEPWERSDRAGVKNVNYYILKGMLEPFADVTYLGKIKDELEPMKKLFSSAINEYDILLSSGGASKGKYDFTKDIAKAIDLDVKFTTTNIRPGRPLIFGVKGDRLFFGLPGYPSALLVNAYEFLLPLVKKMAGMSGFENKKIKVIAKEDINSKEGRVDFVRVKLLYEDGMVYAVLSSSQQTSNFLSMSESDALVIIDEKTGGLKKMEVAEAILI